MSETLVLEMRDEDPWSVAKEAFDVVAAYLQPDREADALETANRLDTLTPARRKLKESEEAEEDESFLLEIWEIFVMIALQVPYDHPSQRRLIELTSELKLLGVDSHDVRYPSGTIDM